jgi:HD-like signal output (HDOD) protein
VFGTDDAAPAPVDTVTVVFVGDDPDVVQTLHDAAARRHGAWDVHFIESGQAALALFGELPSVDVMAVHMHVSGLPVADLLTEVRRRSPHTVRVVASGRSDGESALDLIGIAHRVMPMPRDIELLFDLIEQIRSGVSTRLSEPVSALVGDIDRLPSPPAMFQRLAELIASDDWSIDDLAHEIAQDPALTGEILKLVNSSFYGAAERVTSVHRAITLVGVDLIRFIVLGDKMFQPSDDLETWIDLERLAHRSKAVALGTSALAVRDRASSTTASAAYLAGLVSEIGLLVLGRVPDICPTIAEPVNDSIHLGAERAIFGGDRFAVGAHLLTLWGFDRPVIDAVRQLSTGDIPRSGLPWYLAASRRLVVEQRFDPHDLASRQGTKPDLDEALDVLLDEADPDSTRPTSAIRTGGDPDRWPQPMQPAEVS